MHAAVHQSDRACQHRDARYREKLQVPAGLEPISQVPHPAPRTPHPAPRTPHPAHQYSSPHRGPHVCPQPRAAARTFTHDVAAASTTVPTPTGLHPIHPSTQTLEDGTTTIGGPHGLVEKRGHLFVAMKGGASCHGPPDPDEVEEAAACAIWRVKVGVDMTPADKGDVFQVPATPPRSPPSR